MGKMIEKLTKEQEKKMGEYVDRYIKIGLDTSEFTKEEALEDMKVFYKEILNIDLKDVLILDNPIECIKMVNRLELQDEHPDWDDAKVDEYYTTNKYKFYNTYLNGSFDAHYFAFYDFIFDELGVQIEPNLKKLYDVYHRTLKYSNIYCMTELAILSRKPSMINRNERGLHSTEGPAISYRGFSLYYKDGERLGAEEAKELENLWRLKILDSSIAAEEEWMKNHEEV